MNLPFHTADTFRFLKTLNPGKITNMAKIYLSYACSVVTKRAVVWGKPWSMSVEPVNFCNLACPECPAGNGQLTRPKQKTDLRLYEKILDEAASRLIYLMLYFQGEPYLHKGLFAMIQTARQRKIYTALSTNAQLIDSINAEHTVRSGLHRILISMDGLTQEVYGTYRKNGRLDKVLEAISHLRHWRKELNSATPYIIVQFIVFGTNQHQLANVRRFALDAGADKVEIKTAQLYDFEYGNPLMTSIDRYSRYKKTEDGRYLIKNKLPDRCFRLWNGTVVTAAGNVVPCCFDKDEDMIMGNAGKQSLYDIWKNNRYMLFRQKILKHRKKYAMCRNCTEHF